MSTAYKDLFPEHSGPGKMDDNWWARYGLEETAMDTMEDPNGSYPAHDRLHALLHGTHPKHNGRGEGCPFGTEGCSPAYLCDPCCEALIEESAS